MEMKSLRNSFKDDCRRCNMIALTKIYNLFFKLVLTCFDNMDIFIDDITMN